MTDARKMTLTLAANIRWKELREGSPFTIIDRQMLGEMYDAAIAALSAQPSEREAVLEEGRATGLDEAAIIFDKRAEENIMGSAWYTEDGRTIYDKIPQGQAKPANGPAIAYLANCDHAAAIRALKSKPAQGEQRDLTTNEARMLHKAFINSSELAYEIEGPKDMLCSHEPYEGRCIHCGIPFKDGQPLPVAQGERERLSDGWQPIETAPEDRHVIVAVPVYWSKDGSFSHWDTWTADMSDDHDEENVYSGWRIKDATLWRPLPPDHLRSHDHTLRHDPDRAAQRTGRIVSTDRNKEP